MTTLERSIFINAPFAAVEIYSTDAVRWPEWYAGVEQATPDGIYPRPGGVVKVVYKAAGTTFEITFTSQEYVPGQRVAAKMAGMITGINRTAYAPEGQGTRVSLTFEYELPGGIIGKALDRVLVERMNAQNLEQSLEGLKATMEGWQNRKSPA